MRAWKYETLVEPVSHYFLTSYYSKTQADPLPLSLSGQPRLVKPHLHDRALAHSHSTYNTYTTRPRSSRASAAKPQPQPSKAARPAPAALLPYTDLHQYDCRLFSSPPQPAHALAASQTTPRTTARARKAIGRREGGGSTAWERSHLSSSLSASTATSTSSASHTSKTPLPGC